VVAGLNVWDLQWERQGPDSVEVFDPTYRETYRMGCYRARRGDQVLFFAAGETSANVWMFCVEE
jgi:hypothetical protein